MNAPPLYRRCLYIKPLTCFSDLSQKQLETVIPRSEPAYVYIVAGKDKGQIGEILQKDKSLCTASVQLLSDRDVLLTLSYESICEYVGDISDFDV